MASAGSKLKLPKPCNLPNLIKPQNKEKFKAEIKKAKDDGIIKLLPKNNKLENGKYLYLIKESSPERIIITNFENEKNEYKMKHHKIAEGENILMGGEIKVKGNTYVFDNNSGHYQPDKDCDRYLKELLEQKYNFKFISSKEKQLSKAVRRDNVFEKVSGSTEKPKMEAPKKPKPVAPKPVSFVKLEEAKPSTKAVAKKITIKKPAGSSWKTMNEANIVKFIDEKYGTELRKQNLITASKGSGAGFRLKVQKSSVDKIKKIVPAEIVDRYLELYKKRRGK
jgi:hypothetical protein